MAPRRGRIYLRLRFPGDPAMIFREFNRAVDQVQVKARSDPSALSSALRFGTCKLGLPEFKPEQKEAIRSALCGRYVFVTLPTGFGKSATYQALP